MKTRTFRATQFRAVVLAAVAALALAACSSDAEGGADAAPPAFDTTHVGADAFAAATEVEGVTVVDVRTPEEFAAGHLPGAVNLNVEGADFAAQVAALDPDGEYAIYCRSGNRSRVAIDYMTAAGVSQTVGLEGGIGAWNGDVVTE